MSIRTVFWVINILFIPHNLINVLKCICFCFRFPFFSIQFRFVSFNFVLFYFLLNTWKFPNIVQKQHFKHSYLRMYKYIYMLVYIYLKVKQFDYYSETSKGCSISIEQRKLNYNSVRYPEHRYCYRLNRNLIFFHQIFILLLLFNQNISY